MTAPAKKAAAAKMAADPKTKPVEDVPTELYGDKPPAIHQALADVMRDVEGVAKRSRNQSSNYNFRGIDEILNAVGPVLRKHRIVIMPKLERYAHTQVEVGNQRTYMQFVTTEMTYAFHGPAGDHLSCTVVGQAMDSGDKAVSKAQSVALRIALIQVLALPTDDRDPDHDTYEIARAEHQAQDQRGGQRQGGQRQQKASQQRQWLVELDELTDFEEVRALYMEADAAGATKYELNKIFERGEAMNVGGDSA